MDRNGLIRVLHGNNDLSEINWTIRIIVQSRRILGSTPVAVASIAYTHHVKHLEAVVPLVLRDANFKVHDEVAPDV